MAILRETLGTGDKRQAVIDDACQVLDLEVADKSGLSGAAIKAAFKVVKGIKPGFIREVVDTLLNEFLDAVQPVVDEADAAGTPAGQHLNANSGRVAEALLEVTDARVERSERAVIKKTYSKLRPGAMKHVQAAAPRLGEMLERHLDG